MSLSTKLSPHLPFIRRYARALTGDQPTGDAYVRATLEALASGNVELSGDLHPRAALYRVFNVVWESTGAKLETPSGEANTPRERLLRIPPRSRQAFLLTAVEGFSTVEAGRILGVPFEDVEALIAEAQADIAALVRELGHSVSHVASTRQEAADAARAHAPGLVLADIQLADGSSGIDAVRDILVETDTPVIFITAFPERLLTGERPEPTFLITKPFQPETVKAAIGQALFFHPGRVPA